MDEIINKAKLAVVAHYYYPEIWGEITDLLQKINCDFDLYITTPECSFDLVSKEVSRHFPNAKIRRCDDVGMDVLPFLRLMPELIYKNYTAVCKVHSKKGIDEQGAVWRRCLLDGVIGSTEQFNSIGKAFADNPDLQLLGYGPLYQSAKLLMYGNYKNLVQLSKRVLGVGLPASDWGFFLGTMFWVRPIALSKLAYFVEELFVSSNNQYSACQDGRMEHAIERFFGLIPLQTGGKVGVLYPSKSNVNENRVTIVNPCDDIGHLQSPSNMLRGVVNLQANLASLRAKVSAREYSFQDILPPALKDGETHSEAYYLLKGQYKVVDSFNNKQLGALATKEQLINWQLVDWKSLESTNRPNGSIAVVMIVGEKSKDAGLLRKFLSAISESAGSLQFSEIVVVTAAKKMAEELSEYSPQINVIDVPSVYSEAQKLNVGFSQSACEHTVFFEESCITLSDWVDQVRCALRRGCNTTGSFFVVKSDHFAQIKGLDVSLPYRLSVIDYLLRNYYLASQANELNEILTESNLKALKSAYDLNNEIFNMRWKNESLISVSEQIIEELAFELTPQNNLELLDGKWLATEVDPYFQLGLLKETKMLAGWYVIELNISSSRRRDVAKLYFDSGSGVSEAGAFSVPFLKNESVKKVFNLPADAHYVRFDPQDGKGHLDINDFRISKINERTAFNEMTSNITQSHSQFKGMMPRDLARYLGDPALQGAAFSEKLYHLYSDAFELPETDVAYEDWIDLIETPSLPSGEQVNKSIRGWNAKPIISIIVPTYNTDDAFLRLCINSVLEQSYPYWELCIADDASTSKTLKNTLKEYAKKDNRIKVVFREDNGHISEASNSALEICSGDFVALLDHDDELAKDALFYMVDAVNNNPEASIFYSDEDKISETGMRHAAHFKSDWNPDLFFAQNYVSHLGVYKRELLQKIKGFRKGVEGSQDQDLFLRCLPYITDSQVVHVPRVLYHWRAIEGSTAMGSDQKDYTSLAGVKALSDYFADNGPSGTKVAVGEYPNTYRVKFPIPRPAPLVSLLIPTRDRLSLVEVAVRSIIEKSTYTNFEILILDNGSEESETLDFFATIQKEDGRVKVLRYDHPFNYSAINNFGAEHAKGSILGLVNNDIDVISEEWLAEMVSHCCRDEVGCVGAKLYYSNETIQHAGVIIGLGGVAGHSHKNFPRDHQGYFRRLMLPQSLSAVTAACLLIRKEIFDEVGGLDEKNLAVAFNDVDFCLKVREAGYRNLWTPYAELYHYESISRGVEDTPEKQARFASEVNHMKSKWGTALHLDPFYSPSLTLDREDFSITQSPQLPFIVEK